MSLNDCLVKSADESLKTFYANYAARGKSRGAVAGGYSGGTAATGGLAAVSDYANSMYSAAKEDLIRDLAGDLNDILGFNKEKKIDTSGDINKIVEKMSAVIPNPRKRVTLRGNAKGETKYTDMHKKICKSLAVSINKRYGSAVIDLEQSDNALCNSVSEIVSSLISGMHSEFSIIAADVSQVIRNLTVLMEYLKRSHDKMKEVVNASNDPEIRSQSERVDGFYTKLVGETNRQLAVLNNLMGGVISPVNKDFLQIMRDSDDFKGFVEDIKSSLGSEEFGNKLGYLLAGVNNLAQSAKTVDKALKEIGMSLKDYKNTTGIENLRDEIYALLARSDKMTAEGLVKFMKAADILYRNDLQHEQIVSELEGRSSKSGGECTKCGAVDGGECNCAGGYDGGYAGGEDGGEGGKKYTDVFDVKEGHATKQYAERNKFRKVIFADFERQLLTMYQKIVGAVQQIGPKIGTEIPVTDELQKFVRAFNQIEGANRASIGSALSGYNKTGSAKDVKNNFLSSLEVVDVTLDPLVAKNQSFRELRSVISELIKLVDTFSNKFVEIITQPLAFSRPAAGGENVAGGVIVDSPPPVGSVEKYASFGRAQFQLYYFTRIASIKRSMARAVNEKKDTSADYERVMGQAVARMINVDANYMKDHLDSLNNWKKDSESWKNIEEFDKALPKNSVGRVLYFYINTVSGFEPTTYPSTRMYGNLKVITGKVDATRAAYGAANTLARTLNAAAAVGGNDSNRFANIWNFAPNAAAAVTDLAGLPVDVRGVNRDTTRGTQHQFLNGGGIANTWANHPTLTAQTFTDRMGCRYEDLLAAVDTGVPPAFDKSNKSSLISKRIRAAERIAEFAKDLEMKAFDAKKGLLEIAQNVDLYLSSFTDSVLTKPEALLNLAKIMQRVAIVRKMYTDASGDNLAELFEQFPSVIANEENVEGKNNVRRPGQNLPENAIRAGNPVNWGDKDHYYKYVSDVTATNAGFSTVGNHRMALDFSDLWDDEVPTKNSMSELLKLVEKSVMGVRTLENILLAFAEIGNEQTSKTFMSHGAILKKLFNYVILSSISRHYVGGAGDNPYCNEAQAIPADVINGVTINNSPFANNNISNRIVNSDKTAPLRLALSISINQIDKVGNGSFKDDFTQTDKILEIILKAICAKVMTVLGLYELYNKPKKEYLSLDSVRQILGGGYVERPKIIPEAIDLYCRLPLLAEWYRGIFVGKSDSSASSRSFISSDGYMLSLIPDITNQWGEFLKVIFVKSDNIEEGNYSESDINTLITEINKIYNAYKGKNSSDTTISAIEGLVGEVNQRYRILKSTEVDNYWKDLDGRRFEDESKQFETSTDNDFVDFDLLDSKNARSGVAPSDKYMDVMLINQAKENTWSTNNFNIVKKLHLAMYKSFHEGYSANMSDLSSKEDSANVDTVNFSVLRYTFDGVIREYRDELKVATTEEERYRIATKAIQDVGRVAEIGSDKLIVFNEMVVSPLATLSSLYNTLRNICESFAWMSAEGIKGVLEYVFRMCEEDNNGHGVSPGGTMLAHAGGNTGLTVADDAPHPVTGEVRKLVDVVLENILNHLNPRIAPFWKELFFTASEAAQHGVTLGSTAAAGTSVLDADFINPEKCKYLSTKRLFKTHLQLFANLNSCCKGKVSINFTNQGYPILNFNDLIGHCENTLNNVKKALVYLRPVIPKSILRKYEDSTNVGSVYWLEENMFSYLLFNEKKNNKILSTEFKIPVAAAGNPWDADKESGVVDVTLPQINSILKSSFGLIKKRSNVVGQTGAYEQALTELCVYGIHNKQFRSENNSDAASTFPFNVIDLVDDLDPSIGKIRRMLLDKTFTAQIGAVIKQFGALDTSNNRLSRNYTLYQYLRTLAADTSGGANINITDLNQVPDITDNYYNAPNTFNSATDRLEMFLDDTVDRFIEGGADWTAVPAQDKLGTPRFGRLGAPDGNDTWLQASPNLVMPDFDPNAGNLANATNFLPDAANILQAGAASANVRARGAWLATVADANRILTSLVNKLAAIPTTNLGQIYTGGTAATGYTPLIGPNSRAQFNTALAAEIAALSGPNNVASPNYDFRATFNDIVTNSSTMSNANERCLHIVLNGATGATAATGLMAAINGIVAVHPMRPGQPGTSKLLYCLAHDLNHRNLGGGGGGANANTIAATRNAVLEVVYEEFEGHIGVRDIRTALPRYLIAQIDELNNRFLPVINKLNIIFNPAIKENLINLGMPANVIVDLEALAMMISRLRFSIASHHMEAITRHNGTLGLSINGYYASTNVFKNAWNNCITQIMQKIYYCDGNNIDAGLDNHMSINAGSHVLHAGGNITYNNLRNISNWGYFTTNNAFGAVAAPNLAVDVIRSGGGANALRHWYLPLLKVIMPANTRLPGGLLAIQEPANNLPGLILAVINADTSLGDILDTNAAGGNRLYENFATVQAGPLTRDNQGRYNVPNAYNQHMEAWVRKLILSTDSRIAGNNDDILKLSFNENAQLALGSDINGAQVPINFDRQNAAFVLQRILLYDGSKDNSDFLSTSKEEKYNSIFQSKGLIMQFNQLIASYIACFIEDGSKKFYTPLIDGLVNSKLSSAINAGQCIADLNIPVVNTIGLPPEGAILCASIARAIRSILNRRVENSKDYQFATNSLLEVSAYIRESMKGNLPHFARLFEQLSDLAGFYKKMLLDLNTFKYDRQPVTVAANFFDPNGLSAANNLITKSQVPYVNPNTAASHAEVLRYYRTMLDSIEISCGAVLRSINQVYKELNDTALFGETYSGSLLDVKNKSGKYPLAVPSILQVLLHHKMYETGCALPGAKFGSEKFKLNFAFRLFAPKNSRLNSSNVSGGGNGLLDYMPGVNEVINSYNNLIGDSSKLPKALIESSLKTNLDLMDIIFDLKIRNAWLLDAQNAGVRITRREMYGSAQQVSYNLATYDAPVATPNPRVNQLQLPITLQADAWARGLSADAKNQAIFTLKVRDGKKMGNHEISFSTNDVTNMLAQNINDSYPANIDNLLTRAAARFYGVDEGAVPGGVPAIVQPYRAPVPAEFKWHAYADGFKVPSNMLGYTFGQALNSRAELVDLLNLMESGDITYNKRQLSDYYANIEAKGANDRKQARFFNILDLNIVPINFHALQRDVPLINLLNYSLTFDKSVVEKMGAVGLWNDTDNDVLGEDENNVTNIKSAFARMLIHPYANVSPAHWHNWHSQIALGATGSDIPMDRPKYFSDQIFGKVCLQDLNPSKERAIAGPSAVYQTEAAKKRAVEFGRLMGLHLGTAETTALKALINANASNTTTGFPAAIKPSLMRMDPRTWGTPGVGGPTAPNRLDNYTRDGANAQFPAHAVAANQCNPAAAISDTNTPTKFANIIKSKIDSWNIDPLLATILKTGVQRHADYVTSRYEAAVATALAAAPAAGRAGAVLAIAAAIFPQTEHTADGKVAYDNNAGAGCQNLETYFRPINLLRTIAIVMWEKLTITNSFIANPSDYKTLHYFTDDEEVKEVRLGVEDNVNHAIVDVLGKLRYDTKIVRNLSWFSHLHRFLLWNIKEALRTASQPVVTDQGVIDSTLIDFKGYQTQRKAEYRL